MPDLIIDGGTTNLRVYLMGADGSVTAKAAAEGGVKYTALDGNDLRLRRMLKDCVSRVLQEGSCAAEEIGRCTAYGMITSGLGLLELPHLAAPASAEDLRRGMRSACFEDIAPFEIAFIPGVRNFRAAVDTSNVSEMDMMRGEETESIGLAELLELKEDAIFVLPGSHNKFIRMSADRKILGCMTSVSGELLDAITHHTILSGSVDGSFCSAETYDPELARQGAEECFHSGLGRAAFAGRILSTLGGYTPAQVQSYLLGAVLAEDAKALGSFARQDLQLPVYVAGKEPLQSALLDVLGQAGCTEIRPVPPELSAVMGLAGARRIAFGN